MDGQQSRRQVTNPLPPPQGGPGTDLSGLQAVADHLRKLEPVIRSVQLMTGVSELQKSVSEYQKIYRETIKPLENTLQNLREMTQLMNSQLRVHWMDKALKDYFASPQPLPFPIDAIPHYRHRHAVLDSVLEPRNEMVLAPPDYVPPPLPSPADNIPCPKDPCTPYRWHHWLQTTANVFTILNVVLYLLYLVILAC